MNTHPRSLEASIQSWPIEGEFVISRGARREAVVVVARIADGEYAGRGECVPYARYGESPEDVVSRIEAMSAFVEGGGTRSELQAAMPAGAARNALDCALWDLEAKAAQTRVYALLGLDALPEITTTYTISLGAPEEMAARATWASNFPLLKLKLGAADDARRMAAVRAARPDARLTVDANEGWTIGNVEQLLDVARENDIELVEQPLPADSDGMLADISHPVAICADESFHTIADVSRLKDRYDAINIKLDKTGGLTEALRVRDAARQSGLKIMVGCMVGTSLAMAPAFAFADDADWVDLDGPLLLARDRKEGLVYQNAQVAPPTSELWG